MHKLQTNRCPKKSVQVNSLRSRAPSVKSESVTWMTESRLTSAFYTRHVSIDSMVAQLKTLSRQLGSMQVDDN